FNNAADLQRASAQPAPKVSILHHPGSAAQAGWAEGLFTEIVLRETAAQLLARLTGAAAPLTRPFEITHATAGGPEQINSYSHSFCGMTLQYLLFWGVDSGLLLLRERRQGIWRRLRSAPVTLTALLA